MPRVPVLKLYPSRSSSQLLLRPTRRLHTMSVVDALELPTVGKEGLPARVAIWRGECALGCGLTAGDITKLKVRGEGGERQNGWNGC